MSVHPKILDSIHEQIARGQVKEVQFTIGDVIVARTRNSEYVFKLAEIKEGSLIDGAPDGHRIYVYDMTTTNSKYPGVISGVSILGTTVVPFGSIISPGCFAIGGSLNIVAFDLGKGITTSGVESVSVNGVQVLPVVGEEPN